MSYTYDLVWYQKPLFLYFSTDDSARVMQHDTWPTSLNDAWTVEVHLDNVNVGSAYRVIWRNYGAHIFRFELNDSIFRITIDGRNSGGSLERLHIEPIETDIDKSYVYMVSCDGAGTITGAVIDGDTKSILGEVSDTFTYLDTRNENSEFGWIDFTVMRAHWHYARFWDKHKTPSEVATYAFERYPDSESDAPISEYLFDDDDDDGTETVYDRIGNRNLSITGDANSFPLWHYEDKVFTYAEDLTTTIHSITGLETERTYLWQVRAKSGGLAGNWSGWDSFILGTSSDTPTKLSTTDTTADSFRAGWTP